MVLDWLNSNSLRNYPIMDSCDRVSDDGLFTIPNSLIVDMSLCSSQLGDLPVMYISTITSNSTSISVEISANTGTIFGTFQTTIPLTSNTNVALTPNSNFPSATGIITFGSSDDLATLPYGVFTFSQPNTTLLMRVYNPIVSGLSWISFSDSTGNTTTLTGNIELIGNSNIQFRGIGNSIYIDAGEGLGLNKICETIPTPISYINGIGPDSGGNFNLIAGTCVSISDTQSGIVITDQCGSPCLGCDSIEALTTQTNSLESSVLNIQSFVNNLQAVINQTQALISVPCSCN